MDRSTYRKAAASLANTSPSRLFGGVDDETWRWLHLKGRSVCPFLADYLPASPGGIVEGRSTHTVDTAALEAGSRIYRRFKRLYEDQAGPLGRSARVLDFGCGWGRITRFFLKDVEPENLVGIDIDEGAIAACRETNRWSRFEICPVFPPTRFEDGSFDFVYAYSVFSHLSEEAHLEWLNEFRRLLKPDGVLIATTLGRNFIEKSAGWATDSGENVTLWQKRAAGCFAPADHWLDTYDRGAFCYQPIDPARNRHFGFACIPESYVGRVWGSLLGVRETHPPEPGFQAIVVCARPAGAAH
jgi:SAM-dependent methyltransferase